MNDWSMGIFKCKTHINGGPPIEVHIGGWINGYFAIDPREYTLSDWGDETAMGWVIAHLPTGYVVRSVKSSSLEGAMQIAEAIDALGDWNFTNSSGSDAFKDGVKQLREKYPSISNLTDFHSPLWLDYD